MFAIISTIILSVILLRGIRKIPGQMGIGPKAQRPSAAPVVSSAPRAKTEKELAAERKKQAAAAKKQAQIEQAAEDIEQYQNQIAALQKYSEYLELERSGCVYGSKSWHKWNNKVIANDNRIYNLTKRMNRAYSEKRINETY